MINNRFNVVYHLLYTVRFIKVECLFKTLKNFLKMCDGKLIKINLVNLQKIKFYGKNEKTHNF